MQQSQVMLDSCLSKLRHGNIKFIGSVSVFESSVLIMFSIHMKTKAGVFKILRFEVNKLTSVFHVSVLLLTMNFVITLSKQSENTLTML